MAGLLALLVATGCADGTTGRTSAVTGDSPRTAASASPPSYRGPIAAPAGDAFYTWPGPLPTGRPGDILWSRQIAPTGPLAGLGVDLHQVLYLSTDAAGRPDAVSGSVLLPTGPARANAPLVGFATGTHGLGDTCAPSKGIAAGTDDWLDYFVAAARQGWAVAATDYEGLGTPGTHTYSVGRSEGHAVIDAVRAARRLPDAGPPSDGPVAFWGYSQGGGAAAWAGELSPVYAPELHTVAVAAGGVPADLSKVSEGVDGAEWSGANIMSGIGLDAAYPELHLADHVTATIRDELDQLKKSCSKELIPKFAGKKLAEALTSDLLHDPRWQQRLSENSLGGSAPAAPILLFHGGQDTVVDLGQARDLARAYCADGAEVTWREYAGDDHEAASYRLEDATAFLADRFAGRPATSTC
ncbi:Secretory lipase [Parafrankia irregularis]|uniref:Secretory lipase n=1 Tax=Parafrankia irregularis TaxID=795642 RepID=A0A0S4QEJ6_9ACTN|nr:MULTISPECIES: lipase family protein [Parafrankia]CUU53678.1 Secretory lipase [Parafrankia irregularis]